MHSEKYCHLISKLEREFNPEEFTIWRTPETFEYRAVDLLISNIYWRLIKFPIHLFVIYEKSPEIEDFEKLMTEGLHYARRAFSPGTKAWFRTISVVPVIVCDSASEETKNFAQKRHQKFFETLFKPELSYLSGYFYYPVLVTLDTNDIHYWKGYDFIGSAVWPITRGLIKNKIEKSVHSFAVR